MLGLDLSAGMIAAARSRTQRVEYGQVNGRDLVGLPGPGPFTSAALGASEGVLALRADGSATGLVRRSTARIRSISSRRLNGLTT